MQDHWKKQIMLLALLIIIGVLIFGLPREKEDPVPETTDNYTEEQNIEPIEPYKPPRYHVNYGTIPIPTGPDTLVIFENGIGPWAISFKYKDFDASDATLTIDGNITNYKGDTWPLKDSTIMFEGTGQDDVPEATNMRLIKFRFVRNSVTPGKPILYYHANPKDSIQ